MTGKTRVWRTTLLILALAAAAPGSARPAPQAALQQRVEAKLAEVGPGTRFGLVVAAEDGRELTAIAPDARFVPASNTKIFSTAAAYATLAGIGQPDATGGAGVRLETDSSGARDVILVGHGDARLSSAADCAVNCLATLADAVAARTCSVDEVVGDDSLFPDQRWSPGMSWNNIPTRSGTGISALSLDDNELAMRVVPTAPGKPPRVELPAYYGIDNRAVTVAAGATAIGIDRMPGSHVVRLTGTISQSAQPELLRIGIDDPAHYAAWRFKEMLQQRGVRVSGGIGVRHRLLMPADDPTVRKGAPPVRPPEPEMLARLGPPPLAEDVALANKVSQNLHAELLLRRVGRRDGTGSIADGLAAVKAMLAQAGVPRTAYDLSDGSGMSNYNRVTPRGMVAFLRWIAAQPWAGAWRASLPVAGIDGTLARRFKGTTLERRLFAKTGTLSGASALSGFMIGRSGRTLIFSIYANDIPEGVSATKVMDAALELVAEEN